MNSTSLEYYCMLNVVMTDKCTSTSIYKVYIYIAWKWLFENIGNLFGNYLRLGLYLQMFISAKRGQQFAIERRSVTTFWFILFTMTVCALIFAGGIRKGREYFLVLNHPALASYIHTMLILLFIHMISILQYTFVEFIISKGFKGHIVMI